MNTRTKLHSREEWKGRVSDDADCASVGVEAVFHSMRELFGRKWHPIIAYRLLRGGPMGFNELKTSIDDISSKMLSESLTDLEEKGLVQREVLQEKPIRIEYSLTERGRSLDPALTAILKWGRDNPLEPLTDEER